ncbi:MAG: alpha-mannosidase [Lentisphaeria bacterium]|nr:alpha-mannosidase [Lentisphaeria bacterium]
MRPEFAKLLFTNAELFIRRLPRHWMREFIPVQAEFCNVGEAVPWSDREKGDFLPIAEGGVYGTNWEYAWFHITANIPEHLRNVPLALRLNLNGEVLIFDSFGTPFFSLTDKSVFDRTYIKEWFDIPADWIKEGRLDIWVEACASSYLGMNLDREPRENSPHPRGNWCGMVNVMQLGVIDNDVRKLYFDAEVIMSLLYALPETDFRRPKWLRAFNDAIEIYREDPANAIEAAKALEEVLNFRASGGTLTAVAIGNAHLDLAWLWRTKESIRKSARTFASQLRNIENYKGYVFGASQAIHYQMVKENYPGLYNQIKEKIAEGSWEILGGVWVEADCNIPSGESLIRQFLHGKNFFKDEFGFESNLLWQPDVFGYSASMPQILLGCGCKYFLSQKISWNMFNKFPFNTFIWRGIDGSEVLTHFPPEDTYNSEMLPQSSLCYGQNNFAEKDIINEYICAFGIGDGGGGPAEGHLERAVRCADLDGVPRVKFGRVDQFFERMEKYRDKLDVWANELYLELHQGTLTTHADIKKQNRHCEEMLTVTEALAVASGVDDYPVKELDIIWKRVLNNQFHDILPGSSVAEVYEDTAGDYEKTVSECIALQKRASEKLFIRDENSAVIVNTLSYEYSGVIELPETWQGADVDGKELACQKLPNGKVIAFVSIPAWGSVEIRKVDALPLHSMPLKENILENSLIRYIFDETGRIISIFDKVLDKELLPENCRSNELRLYMDYYSTGEAWDIDMDYEANKAEFAEAFAPAEGFSGELFSELTFRVKIGSRCSIIQKIRLQQTRQLDFVTDVSWHEDRKILRVYFPTGITACDAAYDIQYGYIRRPTHADTSWDWAKFEVAARRYMDLSDHEYGFAVLNDCKYGCCVKDKTLSLTLLRAPKYPDRMADMGDKHRFTYSLLPHEGDLINSCVISASAMLNRPPTVFDGMAKKREALFPVSIESENITLEVLKKAEKSNHPVIRLVENSGRKSDGVLHFSSAVRAVIPCNMIEWEAGTAIPVSGELPITLDGFKIATYLVEME